MFSCFSQVSRDDCFLHQDVPKTEWIHQTLNHLLHEGTGCYFIPFRFLLNIETGCLSVYRLHTHFMMCFEVQRHLWSSSGICEVQCSPCFCNWFYFEIRLQHENNKKEKTKCFEYFPDVLRLEDSHHTMLWNILVNVFGWKRAILWSAIFWIFFLLPSLKLHSSR